MNEIIIKRIFYRNFNHKSNLGIFPLSLHVSDVRHTALNLENNEIYSSCANDFADTAIYNPI
jgi:hypothetical protein